MGNPSSRKEWEMIDRVFREKIFCSLDIGTHNIKGALLKMSTAKGSEEMELINVNEHRLYGFKDAHVSNLSELADSINSALKDLTRKYDRQPKEIQLGVSGDLIKSRLAQTIIPLADRGSKVITSKDIEKVNRQVKVLGTKIDEEVLHEIPLQYHIDEADTLLDPSGLYARKLGVDSILILSVENRLRNIVKAVNQAGYEVDHIFFSDYVAADVALKEEERKYGCGFIDVGSQATSVFVFKDNCLKSLEIIPWGGDFLTQAIAKQLNLSFEMADEIKKSYAVVSDSNKYNDEEILLKKEEAYLPIKRAVILEAIKPEVENFIGLIENFMRAPNRRDDVKQGFIVVGGGALLPGLIERVGSVAGVPVRLGKFNFSFKRDLVQETVFLAAIGLASQGYRKNYPHRTFIADRQPWFKECLRRGKELYEEYF